MAYCTYKNQSGKRCHKYVWRGSKTLCFTHDPATTGKRRGRGKDVPRVGGNGAAPASVTDAKRMVADLMTTPDIRPREWTELARVFATLSELEQKMAADNIGGLLLVDVRAGQRVIVTDV